MHNFIEIAQPDGSVSYGGAQAWFEEELGRTSGCGSVAAANMLACLAKKYPDFQKKWNLDFQENGRISRESFLDFQESVFSFVGSWRWPKPMGIGIWRYTRRTLLYAASRQVYLQPHALVTSCISDHERPLAFIRGGLKRAGAVTLLTTWNSFADIKNHFITITDIEKTDGGEVLLEVSTWGKKAVYSYDEIWQSWQSCRAVGTALVYFTPAESPAVTEKSGRRCHRLLFYSVSKIISYFFQK